MKKIATLYSDYKEKLGIPRQSRLVNNVSKIVFEPEFSSVEAFRGIEDFSHIWILWEFSENVGKPFSPSVRPPRLGGNKKMGVFATRSPFRPNPIGLSCVKFLELKVEDKRVVLYVLGADILDGTPIYDIKPYVSYTDSVPDAVCGFSDQVKDYSLKVSVLDGVFDNISKNLISEIVEIVKQDPRPSYHDDENRVYGFNYALYEVKFTVKGDVATIISCVKQ